MGLLKRLLLGLILVTSLSLQAEEDKSYLKTIGKDFVSPVTTNARYVLIGGLIATTTVYVNKRNKNYQKIESFDDSKPLRDLGIIGDYIGYGILNATYTLSMWYYGANNDDEKALKDAEIMARASAMSLLMTTGLKTVVSEKRPGYPDDDNSFPSGHAAGAFSFAGVVAARHGWGWGFAAHALAGFVAVSRVNDDFHYLHDIMAGATIGAAYAWGVSERAMEGNDFLFTLLPAGKKGLMAGLTYSF